MDLMPIEKDYIIEKRNIVNEMKANGWTLQELRFFNLYLSKINARDVSTRLVRFSLDNFGELMGLERIRVDHTEKVVDRLLSKIIHVPKERGGYTAFQLFKRCEVSRDDNNVWYVEFNAHSDALPLLFDFKERYFNYPLWVILRLTSPNHFRMYEILKQFEYVGARSISLEELRDMLGIESNEYPRWERFKVRILDSCQAALAEKTDIKYTYEPIRRGRGGKVTGIKFIIEKNMEYIDQLCFDEFIDSNEYTVEAVASFPVSEEKSPPKSATEKKKALDEAKKSEFWYYAKLIADKETGKKNSNVKTTPEKYAVGIVKNWEEAGYQSVTDLVESGEISRQDVDNKPSFDLEALSSWGNK